MLPNGEKPKSSDDEDKILNIKLVREKMKLEQQHMGKWCISRENEQELAEAASQPPPPRSKR